MISFDSLILKAFIDENKEFITGGRINKIQQPTRRELILSLRNSGQTRQFYINIDPKMYHVCFMSDKNSEKRLIEIPQKPPMFCMLLRKYLGNSKIAKVNQPDGERILELFFETYNEIGDKIYLCLAVELMGKYSNVILYNTDTNIILGCAHNVGADKSQVREVYGQIPYTYPPEHSSKYFIEERYGFLFNYLKQKATCHCEPVRARQSSNLLYITKQMDCFVGCKKKNDEKHPPRNDMTCENVNSLIDNYYATLTYKTKFKALKSEYLALTNQKLKKCEKSLNEMHAQLKQSENYDKFRLYGDLLMGNLYNLKDYTNEAKVFDYENNQGITIPLKSTKTVKENANDYYKKYNKGKTAGIKLSELIEENKQNKEYLESILYSVEIAKNIDDLKEIEQEISTPHPAPLPLGEGISCVQKPDGTRIYIGKNNKQNDYIISKLAGDEDLWFHTKDCPGSHVLLKSQNITDDLILECAKLAKENSQGKNSSKIGVIYTKRKYLRKPPKANLGYVTYKNEKEIVID